MQQPQRVFQVAAEALAADMLAGHVVQKVTTSTKNLLQATGFNPDTVLQGMSQEDQQTVRAYFA